MQIKSDVNSGGNNSLIVNLRGTIYNVNKYIFGGLMNYLQQAKDFFSKDRFATEVTGIEIDEVKKEEAVCSLRIEDRHLNAAGTVMGGVIFTLADFTFAIASNIEQPPTVSMTASITYLGVCKGDRLISRALCEKSGKSTCVYTIYVDDNLGNKVAIVSVTGFRKER